MSPFDIAYLYYSTNTNSFNHVKYNSYFILLSDLIHSSEPKLNMKNTPDLIREYIFIKRLNEKHRNEKQKTKKKQKRKKEKVKQ